VVIGPHHFGFGNDGIHFLLGQACCCIVYALKIFQNSVYIAKALPHQSPCRSHSRLLFRPSVVMYSDVVTTVISVSAFLWPGHLVGTQFTVIVMTILSSRSQPCLHMGEWS